MKRILLPHPPKLQMKLLKATAHKPPSLCQKPRQRLFHLPQMKKPEAPVPSSSDKEVPAPPAGSDDPIPADVPETTASEAVTSRHQEQV